MKILIVEDEATLARIIARNLSARGHAVRIAESAEEALIQVTEDRPDVLVLDVNLPDYSGWEVLRRLGDEGRCRVRVIVISAAEISKKRLQEFKPETAMQKPFPISSLLHAIEGEAAGISEDSERRDFS